MSREEFVQHLRPAVPGSGLGRGTGLRPAAVHGTPRTCAEAFQEALFSADRSEQRDLLSFYPDLGSDAADDSRRGEESQRDQASAGLNLLNDEDHEAFAQLTQAYRERFGIPLIVSVRDVEKRDQILKSGWARMHNSPTQEHASAMIEIAKIANHRFDDLVADASPILLARAATLEEIPEDLQSPSRQQPADEESAPGLIRFNELSEADARAELESCLHVPRWVDVMLEGRPYASVPSALHRARLAATSFTDAELEAALARHPRIGERAGAGSRRRVLATGTGGRRRRRSRSDRGDPCRERRVREPLRPGVPDPGRRPVAAGDPRGAAAAPGEHARGRARRGGHPAARDRADPFGNGAGHGMSTLVIEGAHVATVDPARAEYAGGHVVVTDNVITAVGPGRAPDDMVTGESVRRVDASGCLVTPGFVNTHHHLYQWITRGLAVDDTLFGWLTTLYPVWGGIDAELVHTAATGALAWLAGTGCTTTTDHHYVFPRDGGDVLAAEVQAARRIGLRFHPTRGSMDLGQSSGGLPPDNVVEDVDDILAATESAIGTFHDPSFGSMLRIGVAPCSPFSVTADLLKQSADLARRAGVRMHTHLAETVDEEEFCQATFGRSPVEYVEELGWLGPDVWLAHAVHLSDAAIERLAATGTSVAHCPTSNARLGAGICRSRDLRDAGVAVGLGVDGAASNEACSLLEEVRHALLFARARGGPRALTVRDALEMATMGGARVLGREAEIGSLEAGKLADLAVWRLDTLPHIDIADPVAALVLGAPPPLELLVVNGRAVVERGIVMTVDEDAMADEVFAASRVLLGRAGAH